MAMVLPKGGAEPGLRSVLPSSQALIVRGQRSGNAAPFLPLGVIGLAGHFPLGSAEGAGPGAVQGQQYRFGSG